jgi:hypothetical protein
LRLTSKINKPMFVNEIHAWPKALSICSLDKLCGFLKEACQAIKFIDTKLTIEISIGTV